MSTDLLVTFFKGRAIFDPYVPETDKNPQTEKTGIRVHWAVIGFLLSLIGKAQKVECANGAVYLNVNSAKEWCNWRGIKRIDPLAGPVFFGSDYSLTTGIQAAVRIARLSMVLKNSPDDLEVLKNRANVYEFHGNHQKALSDLSEAIERASSSRVRAEFLFRRAICYWENAHDSVHALEDLAAVEKIDPTRICPSESFYGTAQKTADWIRTFSNQEKLT